MLLYYITSAGEKNILFHHTCSEKTNTLISGVVRCGIDGLAPGRDDIRLRTVTSSLERAALCPVYCFHDKIAEKFIIIVTVSNVQTDSSNKLPG